MKSFTTIAKNLKLLFRSKESAYTIVFGPLLIILLVSFAFMGSSDEFTVRLGVYAEEHTEFSDRTIGTLNNKNYIVSVYPSNDTCVNSVKQDSTHACIVFSQGEEGKEEIPVTFYLDFSRINIVYQIIDDLSGELDFQADSIRKQLASNDAVRLQTAAQLIEESAEKTEDLTKKFTAISSKLGAAKGAIGVVPNMSGNLTDLRLLKGFQQGMAQNTKIVADEAIETLKEVRVMLKAFENECDCPERIFSDLERLEEEIDDAESKILHISDEVTGKQLEEAQLLLRFVLDDLELMQGAMSNFSSAGTLINDGMFVSFEGIEEGREQLAKIHARLTYTGEFLRGQRAEASVASSPITTSIVSITASDDTLSFAYPYLLVLVIMFIGVLLGSTLIVTDKSSKAAFRNFTTPTPDSYHVTMAFLTAFIILIVEVIIILIASSLFVAQPLFLNLSSTLLIISVAIVIFTFLGMIIGYLSNTHEAAMIASISVASVLLFVSNLVVPIEGMARFAQFLSGINPYIVLSELLKKSMLYDVTMGQITTEILTLALFISVLFVITIAVQRHIKNKYFKQEEQIIPVIKHVPKPLLLADRYVHNEIELMDSLDRMTRFEFEKVAKLIAPWVKAELRNKRLARQLSTSSKERMILRLDKHLKHHGKHIKR